MVIIIIIVEFLIFVSCFLLLGLNLRFKSCCYTYRVEGLGVILYSIQMQKDGGRQADCLTQILYLIFIGISLASISLLISHFSAIHLSFSVHISFILDKYLLISNPKEA